ncbi:hypothetical protein CBM2587_B60313 [Cupriavidus taiwanensis]|uniref:Uncharacterized protein n=2 Tax=Cupriavidus taiwanensis TaxID=164546 RepID=A0A375C5Y5_9BURK|nr:hypothetical protein CBM2587_B60313 [Cupriavidus taiwanensis]
MQRAHRRCVLHGSRGSDAQAETAERAMVSATDLAKLLGAAFSQANRLLRLQTLLRQYALMPEQLRAAEQLDGGGFRIELTVVSDNAGRSEKLAGTC